MRLSSSPPERRKDSCVPVGAGLVGPGRTSAGRSRGVTKWGYAATTLSAIRLIEEVLRRYLWLALQQNSPPKA